MEKIIEQLKLLRSASDESEKIYDGMEKDFSVNDLKFSIRGLYLLINSNLDGIIENAEKILTDNKPTEKEI